MRVFTPLRLAAAEADPNYRGHIVNTASMAGMLNAPNMGVYNLTKHVVVSISETLYQDSRSSANRSTRTCRVLSSCPPASTGANATGRPK